MNGRTYDAEGGDRLSLMYPGSAKNRGNTTTLLHLWCLVKAKSRAANVDPSVSQCVFRLEADNGTEWRPSEAKLAHLRRQAAFERYILCPRTHRKGPNPSHFCTGESWPKGSEICAITTVAYTHPSDEELYARIGQL